MKKYGIRVIQLVCILLIGSILLCGCDGEAALKKLFGKSDETPAVTQATQAVDTVDLAAVLKELRASMGKDCNVAVAYLGTYDTAPDSISNTLLQTVPAFCAKYPFVLTVAKERTVGSCGDLFCIVTREADASISVTKSADGTYAYDEVLADLDGAGAVLLFANSSGWGPDTQVNITDSTGSYDWYPLLNDYLCTAHMLDADWNNRLMDITPYTEQLRASYKERLKDGWKLPTLDDLLGQTWSCREWTNDGAEHRYEITFNEGTAYVRWNDGYSAQDHEYPEAPYTLETKDGFAVVTFDFAEFAGKQCFNILLDEGSGMLYTMVDVTGDTVEPGWDRLYRTLE